MLAFYALNRFDDLDAFAQEPVETSLEAAIRLLSEMNEDGHLGLVLAPSRVLQFRKEGPGVFWMELLETSTLRTHGTRLQFPAGVVALKAAYAGQDVEKALAGFGLQWEDAVLTPEAEA